MLDEDTRQTDSTEDSIDKSRLSTHKTLPIESYKDRVIQRRKKITRLLSANGSPMITEKRPQVNHELLLGQKVKRYVTVYHGDVGTVKKYSLKQDLK